MAVVSATAVADVAITLSPQGAATPGQTVTVTVSITNNGPSSAQGVTATVVLPNGVTTTIAVPTTLANGQVFTTTVAYAVPSTATTSQTFAGAVSTTTTDNVPGNNTAVAVVSATAVADVGTVVTVPSTVSASVVVAGTVSFGNVGPSPAVGVAGTVTLPIGVQVQGLPAGASTTTVAGFPVIVFPPTLTGLGTVNPSVTTSFTFTFRTPGITGTYAVTSTVATTTAESTTTNNISVASLNLLVVINNASLSGQVFLEVNRDKIFNPGVDLPLANFRAEVVRTTGTSTVVIGSAFTGPDGRYKITGLPPGPGYSVRFFDGSGNAIFGTPFNQKAVTEVFGNPSTGTNSLTVAIVPGPTTPVDTSINNVTLYAGDNVWEQNLPLDPSGVVYDSITRKPIEGATVRLIGPPNFSQANILGGSDVRVTGPNGMYQFFFQTSGPNAVSPAIGGDFTLVVTPPATHLPPQAVQGGVAPDQGLYTAVAGTTKVQPDSQAGGPPVGVNGATPIVGLVGGAGTQYFLRLNFSFVGFQEVIHNNIPLDPILVSGALLVSKTGNKAVAEIGDSVQYTVRIRNTTVGPITNIKLNDLLPAGFRYILGTARLSGVAAPNPSGGVGRDLVFDIGTIAPQATAELTYFVRVGVGAQQGDGINRATVVAPVRSNTGSFKVTVQGGVFSNEGCIIGKVYVDCDGNAVQNNVGGSRELGIPGVRLVMLDGTFVLTDSEGKYSICGVKSQTHVVKVDRTTLPVGSRLVPSSNRNAGVADSLFVDLKGGELARADFIEGSCSSELLDQVKARRAQGGINVPESERATPLSIGNRTGEVLQPILPATRQQNAVPISTPGVR